MSNFSFSHSVFERLVTQTRKNKGLFGKKVNNEKHCEAEKVQVCIWFKKNAFIHKWFNANVLLKYLRRNVPPLVKQKTEESFWGPSQNVARKTLEAFNCKLNKISVCKSPILLPYSHIVKDYCDLDLWLIDQKIKRDHLHSVVNVVNLTDFYQTYVNTYYPD